MKHRIFEDLLLQRMTHSISARDQARLKAHLATCARCRAALAEWQQIAAAVRLEVQERGTMIADNHAQPNRQVTHRHPALVLIAVVSLIIVLGIGFFYRPASSPSLVAQIATASPTPTNDVELVLAARNIENGTVIQSDDVTLYRLPVDDTPFNSVVELGDVVGKIARTNILCGLPVLTNMLVENARDVPMQAALNQQNDCSLAPLSEPAETENIVVAVQELSAGSVLNADSVALRRYPAQLVPDAAMTDLEAVIGKVAQVPIYRESVILAQQLQNPPADRESIIVPADLIQNRDSLLPVGSSVEVIVTMLFVDLGDTTQEAVGAVLPVTPPTGSEARAVTQHVTIALIVSTRMDAQGNLESLRLDVASPEDAQTLRWIVDAHLPITLALLTPA
ncbi:MAG: SAF domain-containing protein [Chloroflexota bacterium]